jgi:Ku70/Ku80 beta-barrel domain
VSLKTKRFYDSPYIVPSDKAGQEAFAVIREAMEDKGVVGLGRVVVSKREHVIALEPHGKGLMGTTLRTSISKAFRRSRCRTRCSSSPRNSARRDRRRTSRPGICPGS